MILHTTEWKHKHKYILGDKISTSMTEEYNGNGITKQEESAMVFEWIKKKKVILWINKEKLLDVLFAIQRCIGQRIVHIKLI